MVLWDTSPQSSCLLAFWKSHYSLPWFSSLTLFACYVVSSVSFDSGNSVTMQAGSFESKLLQCLFQPPHGTWASIGRKSLTAQSCRTAQCDGCDLDFAEATSRPISCEFELPIIVFLNDCGNCIIRSYLDICYFLCDEFHDSYWVFERWGYCHCGFWL